MKNINNQISSAIKLVITLTETNRLKEGKDIKLIDKYSSMTRLMTKSQREAIATSRTNLGRVISRQVRMSRTRRRQKRQGFKGKMIKKTSIQFQ